MHQNNNHTSPALFMHTQRCTELDIVIPFSLFCVRPLTPSPPPSSSYPSPSSSYPSPSSPRWLGDDSRPPSNSPLMMTSWKHPQSSSQLSWQFVARCLVPWKKGLFATMCSYECSPGLNLVFLIYSKAADSCYAAAILRDSWEFLSTPGKRILRHSMIQQPANKLQRKGL